MGISRGLYIETRRPLLILDPKGMQINLGKTPREDAPETAIPAVPYEAINVLPTPFGYKSAFYPAKFFRDNPNTEDPLDGLDKVLFQDIFTYQTVNAFPISVGLAEGGIYLFCSYEGTFDADLRYWTRVQPVEEMPGTKTLWTRVVLDNIVYMYHQAEDLLYAIMPWADYQQFLANNSSAEAIYESEDYQFGIAAMQPTFLNMSGQVGIFKADNRLGIWDTDGSVAWSNALNKFDFKPDATTFAGSTKFSAVAGNITNIKQAGRGFIIYATSSITRVIPASSSERWAATPIAKDIGVLYYDQVAAGPNDNVHYFWATTGGLYQIADGVLQPYESELSTYFKRLAPVINVKMLGGTHLAIGISDKDIADSGATRHGRLVFDGKGNPFITNPPPSFNDPNYNPGFPLNLLQQASGMAPNFGIEDFDPTGEPFPSVADEEALIPCYTGWKFMYPFGINTMEDIKWDNGSTQLLDSAEVAAMGRFKGWTWTPKDGHPVTTDYLLGLVTYSTRFSPDSAYWSYEAGPIVSQPGARFIDLAGDDFTNVLLESFAKLNDMHERSMELLVGRTSGGSPIGGLGGLVNIKLGDPDLASVGLTADPFPSGKWPLPIPTRPDPYPGNASTNAMNIIIPNLLVDLNFVAEEDGCILKIVATTASFKTNIDWTINITSETAKLDAEPGYYTTIGSGATEFAWTALRAPYEEVPGTRETVTVFQCEISGYGYFPKGGFSFRKTHSRSIFKPCEPADSGSSTSFDPAEAANTITNNPPITTLMYSGYSIPPPNFNYGYDKDSVNALTPFVPSIPGYPDTDIQFATFGKGIFEPYYPSYIMAYMKDLLQDKWGVFSEAHSLLFDTLPVNRVERPLIVGDSVNYGVELTQNTLNMGCVYLATSSPYFEALIDRDRLPCILMNFNPYSKIVYGKIGLARAGYTRLTGASIGLGTENFYQDGKVNLTFRSSFNNVNYKILEQYNDKSELSFDLTNSRIAEIPFTLDGRWFTITLQGQFDIQYMTLYGHEAGRMRFVQYYEPGGEGGGDDEGGDV